LVLVGQSRRLATPLTGRERRAMKLAGTVLLAVTIAVAIWSFTHDHYPVSRDGCINVGVAGSLGGQLVHACGADARELCASERRQHDVTALLILPACRKAGIKVGAPAG
jgi:hypothetical protein